MGKNFLYKTFYIKRLILLFFFIICGCEDNITDSDDRMIIPDDSYRYFRVTYPTIHNKTPYFIVRASDSLLLEIIENEISKPLGERFKHINGTIVRGNGDYNYDWSWRFEDNTWTIVEISIELCDGNPFYIEENLDYYINTINGNYCPWSSQIDREMYPGEIIE